MKLKGRNAHINCIYQWKNNGVENRTVILYNDIVDQLKGCSAAW